jgi:hypothetical protein
MAKLFRVDRHVFNRAKPTKKIPVKITEATASGTLLTLTFNQPIKLEKGLTPQYSTDVAGAEPMSAALTTPTTLALTFSEDIDAATQVTIPFEDPAVRNLNGGYVSDSTFPLAA